MPEFWLGMLLLLLFSSTLGWFPVGGRISTNASDMSSVSYALDVANHLFIPALTLTLSYVGEFYLVMRSSLLDVLGEDYITTARAKGVPERRVLNSHAVRNALLPTVTLAALLFGYVIGGAITVEVVFSYQGLGLLTYTAIVGKDYWLLQGLLLFFSVAVNYGDGTQATDPDARHVYTTGGSYNASFTVTSGSQMARCSTPVLVAKT